MSISGETRALPFALPTFRLRVPAVVLLTGICALPIILYIPFLTEPFMRDEGLYATVAQWMLDGAVPYQDAFDNKPPLIFGWFSLAFLIFGENVWAPRLLAAMCLSATAALVYVQGRLVFSQTGGLIAAFVFALSIGIADFQTNANTEYFLLLPIVGALVTFTMGRRSQRLHWYLLAGVCSGLAVMTKQVAIFNFLVLLTVPAVVALREGGISSLASRSAVRPLAMMVAGFGVAISLVAAPFIIVGAFGEFFEGVFLYAVGYSNDSSGGSRLESLIRAPLFFMMRAAPWAIVAGLGVAFVARYHRKADSLVLVAWLGGSGLAVGATGRFYDHYFVLLLPAMALLAPAGFYFLQRSWSHQWARVTAAWLLPIAAFMPLLISATIYLQPSVEARHELKFASGEGALENDSDEIGEYLKAVTSENDFIYNLGFQSEIYFYADRRSPTRFLFDHPFAVDVKYEIEALEALQKNPPLYVADSAAREGRTRRTYNYYAVLIAEFIDENYDYIGRFYYADLYRLREPVASDG